MSVIVSVFVSMLSPKPELSCATELAWVSSSTVTLTPFLSPLPRTTPDIVVVLPDSGRCELAVRQRFVGRSDPGVAPLDQVNQVRILEGQLADCATPTPGLHPDGAACVSRMPYCVAKS